jgi:hypothetical protein
MHFNDLNGGERDESFFRDDGAYAKFCSFCAVLRTRCCYGDALALFYPPHEFLPFLPVASVLLLPV